MTKTCTKCDTAKPSAEFSKSSRAKDGLQSHCKACNAAYYQANRERRLEWDRQYYVANKDKIAARQRKYYKANRDTRLAYQKEYVRRES